MQIKIDGKSIYYEVIGKGTPVLFLHGWGGTSQSLKGLAELVAKDHQSILLDLPGFGKSENPDPSWGIEEYASLIKKFIKKLDLKSAILVGHSFGGTLSLYLASKHPKFVKKLILCAPSFKREGKRSSLSSYGKFLPSVIKKPLYRMLFPKSELYKYPHLEKNFRNLITHDISPETITIRKPTLIIWGTKDSYVPVSHASELNRLIPDSQLKIIEGYGHGLPLREPEIVYESLKAFI